MPGRFFLQVGSYRQGELVDTKGYSLIPVEVRLSERWELVVKLVFSVTSIAAETCRTLSGLCGELFILIEFRIACMAIQAFS